MDLPIAPWEAALGATVRATTPAGRVELKIPPGSQSGKTLRLKGRGLPGKQPGDLYAELQIVVPPARSDSDREAWRKLGEQFDFDPRADAKVKSQ